MFASQLGRNNKAYIHDILVKTIISLNIIQDLRKTFQTVELFGLKLNLEKYSLGVHAGNFLGFMIFQRGLKINPSKITVIQNLKFPRNIKEV